MAMYGPNINEEEIENSSDGNYDQCGTLFDLQPHDTDVDEFSYAKWVDLKCNQRTRALMCSLLGSSKQMFMARKNVLNHEMFML